MKKYLLILLISSFLKADFTYEGEFRAAIGEVFSITVDKKTISFEYTAARISSNSSSNTNMGSFLVTINDNTTLGSGEINKVLFESMVTNGSVIEIRRIDEASTIVTQEDRIELLIQDNRNINGSIATTTIINNQSIRNRAGPSAPNIVNEGHIITVFAKQGSLASKPAGNYRTTIYFALNQT